jgi:hypothetical protein
MHRVDRPGGDVGRTSEFTDCPDARPGRTVVGRSEEIGPHRRSETVGDGRHGSEAEHAIDRETARQKSPERQ